MLLLFDAIALEVSDVRGLELRDTWSFPEHAVTAGAPQLQAIGRALREGTLSFQLHAAHGDPEALLSRLRALADRREAGLLQRGDGARLGWFVITRLSERPRWTFADGKPIAVDARLTLKEYAGDTRPRRAGEAVPGAPSARRAAPAPAADEAPADISVDRVVRR